MEVLRLENLAFHYHQVPTSGIHQLSTVVNQGEFILIAGASGSGKSTLLKLLKPEMTPKGQFEGEIHINGQRLTSENSRLLSQSIGYVQQNPDSQIVTDRVWSELAFGLENIGLPHADIQLRVAEVATYFGIENWFHQGTNDLSGGQKQLLNLASILAMQPNILLLDEPTSQLDPIAKGQFIEALIKINRELNMTILMIEHDLELIYAAADKVWLLEDGHLIRNLTPQTLANNLVAEKVEQAIFPSLPVSIQFSKALQLKERVPLTVKEGLEIVQKNLSIQQYIPEKVNNENPEQALCCKNIKFKYQKKQREIISDVSLSIEKGEIFCLLGGNGVGKSTFMKVVSGLLPKTSGTIKIFNQKLNRINPLYGTVLSVLPQNPATIFFKETVYDDFIYYLSQQLLPEDTLLNRIETVVKEFDLTGLLAKHPLDLSGGEMQKVALAKLLLLDPSILLLDEPTKGIDGEAKRQLAQYLKLLSSQGKTIFIVTHDTTFAADVAKRCGLMFDGRIIGIESPRKFFSYNLFYTTAVNRMVGKIFPEAVSVDDMMSYIKRMTTDVS